MSQTTVPAARLASPSDPKIAKAEPEYLDTEGAAKFLLLGRKTLERMRVEGSGPKFYKVGPGLRAKVVYKKEDLRAFVESVTYSSTSQYAKRP